MTMSQLRAFEAVAAHGTFTAAARALGTSQPAVSQQVAALERTHGILLVQRTTGGTQLTPAGIRLHAVTARLFDAEAEAERVLAAATRLSSGALLIGADAPVHVMPLLHHAAPGDVHAGTRVVTGNSRDLVAGLRRADLDIIVAAGVARDADLHTAELGRQDLAAVVRTDHPLAAAKTIPLAALAQAPLIMREEGSFTRAALERAAQKAGVTLRTALTVDGREGLLSAVAAGLGAGVIAENELLDDPRLVMLDITEPVITVTEALVCRTVDRTQPLIAALFDAAAAQAAHAHPVRQERGAASA